MSTTQQAPLERQPIDRLIHPIQIFTGHKLAGAVLLLLASVTAVIWANSPWGETYIHLLETKAGIAIGPFVLSKTIHHWINDGLMGIFFFLVGLEIKREVIAGELATMRKAALPAVAAVGGMVVPALVYWAINRGQPSVAGWGIPMATDIAFALGVLALLGDRIPPGLKVFLTALAIVDDIGAVLVIAVFYTDAIALVSLAVGLVLFAVAIAANRAGMRNPVAYFILGTLVWVAFLQSGVHATVAGILMALTIPSRTRVDGAFFVKGIRRHIDRLSEVGVPRDHAINTGEQQHVLDDMAQCVEKATAPLQRIEHALVPVVTFLVLPVFALANAGVSVSGEGLGALLASPITTGTLAGLFIGKQVGVLAFTWLAVRLGIADLPKGVGWRLVYGAGLLAGVGFTMSLFIGGLAFPDPAALDQAKVGILAASVLAGVAGWAWLRFACGASASRQES